MLGSSWMLPGKRQGVTSNQVETTSFQIISNSSFTNHPLIRRCITYTQRRKKDAEITGWLSLHPTAAHRQKYCAAQCRGQSHKIAAPETASTVQSCRSRESPYCSTQFDSITLYRCIVAPDPVGAQGKGQIPLTSRQTKFRTQVVCEYVSMFAKGCAYNTVGQGSPIDEVY
jgi:hypothetical protein